MEKLICKNCGKEYKMFMFENFNLSLCEKCFEEFEESGKIIREEDVDEVTHVVTCPLCKKKYGFGIVDQKCETKNCPVHFFLGDLDKTIFAKWIIRKNDKTNT